MDSKARDWYEKMYAVGDDFGAYAIGSMYQNGHGVTVNFKEAFDWFSKVRAPGFCWGSGAVRMSAIVAIAELYATGDTHLPSDQEEVSKWIQKARDLANDRKDRMRSEYQFILGNSFLKGYGAFPLDKTEALKWFQMSAQNNHGASQITLATIYFKGDGVEVNKERARELIDVAGEFYFKLFLKQFSPSEHAGILEWYNKKL